VGTSTHPRAQGGITSHVATIKLEVRDLDSLEAACKTLGVELRRGQNTYRWYGLSVGDTPLPEGLTEQDLGKCDHAIALPNNSKAYEIGVLQRDDHYVLLCDFWSGGYGMEAAVGPQANWLCDEYSAEYATRIYQQDGFFVTRTRNEQGEIILEAER
jgi:hypothetical protein